MAFERFVSRRGHCERLYSDNGSNFRGAKKEIMLAYKQWTQNDNKDRVNALGTDWHFMKPTASHQGGINEAAVKSTKHHLKRMLGKINYSYEHLETFLLKIEAILNSRPLYPLTDDPIDMQAITPALFLIGQAIVLPPAIAAPAKTSNPVKYIRDEQEKLVEHFWHIWRNEYLATLMQRKKWVQEKEPLKVKMVVIADNNHAPTE